MSKANYDTDYSTSFILLLLPDLLNLSSAMPIELTLFPLNNVLYPDGILSLKILEPRHLSMVSHCCRQQKPFVAISLKETNNTDKLELFNQIGTLATIINFDMPSTSLLEIKCRGKEKAKIISHQMQENGLIIGQIKSLPLPSVMEIPFKYQHLVNILENHLQRDGMEKYTQYLKEDWNNPDWLGCRLSELLPIKQQQHYDLFIMEPLERLEKLKGIMKNKGWI